MGNLNCIGCQNQDDRGHLYNDDEKLPLSKLQGIVKQREKDVQAAKEKVSLRELEEKASKASWSNPQVMKDVIKSAQRTNKAKGLAPIALAAEFKRASPSKGDININLDPAEQGATYAKAGASILSVLTEPKWFKGTLTDLTNVRNATKDMSPRPIVLRKDFIIDEYQIYEAKIAGADAVLLMVSILPVSRLQALLKCCKELSIDALVEVVSEKELSIALDSKAEVIGVNNRNLHTFEMDRDRTSRIARLCPDNVTVLALSGISLPEDIQRYLPQDTERQEVHGVLVGEALMRAENPAEAISTLMKVSAPPKPQRVIKICGITDPSDALHAVKHGANLIGLIFVTKSKRYCTPATAAQITQKIRELGERPEFGEPCPDLDKNCVTPTDGAALTTNNKSHIIADGVKRLRTATRRKAHALCCGIFQNESIAKVKDIIEKASLDIVQLHGDESPTYIQQLREALDHDIFIMKVIHISDDASIDDLDKACTTAICGNATNYNRIGAADILLFDTAKGGQKGGTGETFNWDLISVLEYPCMVGGGLNPKNVKDLLTNGGGIPDCVIGVDVAGGVELKEQPGRKDLKAVEIFCENVRQLDSK